MEAVTEIAACGEEKSDQKKMRRVKQSDRESERVRGEEKDTEEGVWLGGCVKKR